MNFLDPSSFWFALAIPVVVVFYLLKRKRVLKLVSSTLLWQKFLAETQANAPFQRLRKNWLLFLQILLLALIVFALARPFLSGNAREARLRVVILDGSASMQATDEKPSRFEKARAEALKWVDGLRDGEQMMVLLAGITTEVKQSPTADKTALRRALESCQPADSVTRLADALKTAGAFTFEKRGEEQVVAGEIHLFSDGAAPDLEDVANKNLPLIYHRVGQGGNNAGLVRLEVKPHPDDPKQRAVFVRIGNYSTNAQRADLELLFENQSLEVRPLELAATNSQLVIFTAAQSKAGVFTARLNLKDDLAADNEASAFSPMPQPVQVLLVTRGNRFLEKALRAAPLVLLTVTPTLTDAATSFDVVVLDDVMPAVWPKANTLAIHTVNTNWFPSWETVKTPTIVDWKEAHSLLRYVSFDNVLVAEALAVKPPTWGVAVVEAAQTPLIVAGQIGRQRLVWIGFDPLQSTWPLRVSFPIFIANAVEWLDPAGTGSSLRMVRPGEPFRLGLAQAVDSAQVTLPGGATKTIPVEKGAAELVIGDTLRQGVYRVKAGTNDVTFCANLLDSNESNITPRQELAFGKYERVAAGSMQRANAELWRWLALAGLAVLLVEWSWYHKRTV